MSVRWITDFLGTAPAEACEASSDVDVLDVRELVDKDGNSPELVERKISAGVEAIGKGRRVIVCCDYGISRSNAIAAGILARLKNLPVDVAAREVMSVTGEAEIKLELLSVVRAAVDVAPVELTGKHRGCARTLVTGGTGFLGRAVIERLRTMGVEVSAPPRAELDLFAGRAELDILIRAEHIAHVIHLANPRVYTSNLSLGSTLVMLRNVLETCALNQIPVTYLSGWEVYSGYYAAPLSADETSTLLPSGVYGETKLLCETLINHFRVTRALQSTVLRLSPVYGRGGDRPKFIYTFIQKARRGEAIVTHEYANGSPALDLLHVDDAASAICKAATSGVYSDFNIGTGHVTTTRQIAQWIVEWIGSSSSVENTLIDADTARVAMRYAKATKEIGWEPTIPLVHGLRDLVESQVGQ